MESATSGPAIESTDRAPSTDSLTHALTRSCAVGQRILGGKLVGPAFPPILSGVDEPGSPDTAVEVTYDMSRVAGASWTAGKSTKDWAGLLPPFLEDGGLGEGGTPLVPFDLLPPSRLWVKDESRNPTWSHKDRLSRFTVGAAALLGAPGVVVASAGNHAVSTAAYAARAGLPCVALLTDTATEAVHDAVTAYGAATFAVPRGQRWTLMREVVRKLGFHPVSNLTAQHSGHPYGAEGYKVIAYELHQQLAPDPIAAVYVPTGYGELLFGLQKGFSELRDLGLIDDIPVLVGCEPAVRGPLSRSLQAGRILPELPAAPTRATSIGATVTGGRAMAAVHGSGGHALLLTDQEIEEAHLKLAHAGMWCELSSAAALAGARQDQRRGRLVEGHVVCVITAGGQRGGPPVKVARQRVTDWGGLKAHLRSDGLM